MADQRQPDAATTTAPAEKPRSDGSESTVLGSALAFRKDERAFSFSNMWDDQPETQAAESEQEAQSGEQTPASGEQTAQSSEQSAEEKPETQAAQASNASTTNEQPEYLQNIASQIAHLQSNVESLTRQLQQAPQQQQQAQRPQEQEYEIDPDAYIEGKHFKAHRTAIDGRFQQLQKATGQQLWHLAVQTEKLAFYQAYNDLRSDDPEVGKRIPKKEMDDMWQDYTRNVQQYGFNRDWYNGLNSLNNQRKTPDKDKEIASLKARLASLETKETTQKEKKADNAAKVMPSGVGFQRPTAPANQTPKAQPGRPVSYSPLRAGIKQEMRRGQG